MTIGSGLTKLNGYPFEVRYSSGSRVRARAAADITADADGYFRRVFSGVEPDIAVIVADESDWRSRQPYGLPFFDNGDDQIRPGIVVMPAGSGDIWVAMGEDLSTTVPGDYPRLLATYPDGTGGLNLHPFFDLVTIHELGHAFEVCGDLKLPNFWLGEIFANLALHSFIATQQPENLNTLEVLSLVGVGSLRKGDRMRANGYSSLEELETHYTGGDDPMDPLNYVWYQYRWQRLVAAMFDADGEAGLVRFWDFFHGRYSRGTGDVTAAALAPLLTTEVSETLGRAIQEWR